MTYANVLLGVGDLRCRDDIMATFRRFGGEPGRWQRADQEAMVEALVKVEDKLELEHPRQIEEREATKATRSQLECLLWP